MPAGASYVPYMSLALEVRAARVCHMSLIWHMSHICLIGDDGV